MGAAAGLVAAKIVGGGMQVGGSFLEEQPRVPRFRPINVQQEQLKAIAGNIRALRPLGRLGERVTGLATEQLASNMERLFPGSANIKELASEAIQSALAGELPKDVVDLIARRAAERGISTGTAGSQFAQFGELKTLGLTSLDRINQGLASAAQWLQIAQTATPQFDFGRFMITPEFQTQVAMAERDAEFQRDWVRNQIDAAFSSRSIWGRFLQQEGASLSSMGSLGGLFGAGGAGGGASGAVSSGGSQIV